jgi:hypothetical protein
VNSLENESVLKSVFCANWLYEYWFGTVKNCLHLISPFPRKTTKSAKPNKSTNRKKAKRLRLAWYFIKLNMDKIAACRYANREPNKQEVGFHFV